MSTAELAPEDAQQRVERFVSRFGPGYRRLVRHAALPLVLTPELLHYLRNAFLRGKVPWVAEVDLLLSDLCEEVGYEQYVMHPAVRARLIIELRAEPDGPERVKEVARLLLQYLRRLERAGAGPGRDALLVQQWSALAYLDSDRVSREVHEALAALVARLQARADEVNALAALANITRNLAPQLDQNPELVALAREITGLLTGEGDPSGQQDGQEPHRIQSPGDLAGRIASAFRSWSDRAEPTRPAAAPAGPSSHPIEVFFCYSHQDERYRDELETHFAPLLRDGTIAAWHDRKIAPGTTWEEDIDRHLRSAQVVLLLVSANFFASDYCHNIEMTRALERERAGQVRVIPIILRPVVGWAQSKFGHLAVLPRDGKPVIRWKHRDDAYVQIARGVRQVAKELAARPPDKENSVIGRDGITKGADSRGSERTLNTAVESPMPRVFICHSIRDRDFVEREIIVLLRQHGLETWHAVDDIQTAAVWDQCLQALEACDWFLIVLSPHSEASEWVRDELHWAFENRPPGRIIPVLIEDCSPWKFHLRLNRIQFVDFRKDREKARRRLLACWGITVPAAMPSGLPARTLTTSFGATLVRIEQGTFTMGSNEYHDERPPHTVRITKPFYLGAHPVTQGQYQAVMGQNPSSFQGSDDLPVECVSWLDAVRFCNTLSEREKRQPCYQINEEQVTSVEGNGYRLPTEAEWEYACRAGSTAEYPFGDNEADLSEYAWFRGNSDSKTHPVGLKQPNRWGLYDMLGNVWEWCQDGYDADYYKKSPLDDPPGPSEAPSRVIRGGSWITSLWYGRPARRNWYAPEFRGAFLGFRLAAVQAD